MFGLSEEQIMEIVGKAIAAMPKARKLSVSQRKKQLELFKEVLQKMGWQVDLIINEDATEFRVDGWL